MKEAPRATRLNIVGRIAIASGLLSGCAAPFTTRSPAEEFASPTKTPLEETLETPLNFTVTPEPTPTREIAPPSVPNGFRPENAATQVVENGTWVVKNADGKTTATWNEKTDAWDYNSENIKYKYTQIGLQVEQSLLEPYLGSLPADNPADHFVDKNGNPAPYGIGPDIGFDVTGKITYPTTEIFGRFRGIVQIDSTISSLIFEIPNSADSSTILTTKVYHKSYNVLGTSGDTMVYDQYAEVYALSRGEGSVEYANQHLVGQQVMLLVMHDTAELNTHDKEYWLARDKMAAQLLNYLADTSSPPIYWGVRDDTQFVLQKIIVPASKLP